MKYISLGIVAIAITLIVALLQPTEPPFNIITVPQTYSFYQSDLLETQTLSLLTTKPDHYYFDDAYVVQIAVVNDETRFPLNLQQIQTEPQKYTYQNETYYPVHLEVQPELSFSDKRFEMVDASLEITYDDGSTILLQLGEWNYLYADTFDTELIIGERYATYEMSAEIETVGGITIETINRTNEMITITEIELLSHATYIDASTITATSCEGFMTVSDCLTYPYDNIVETISIPIHKTVLGGQSTLLYLPLKFTKYPFFHQGAIIIHYQYHQQEFTTIMDDFPFLRTSLFQTSYEDLFVVHEIHLSS